MRVLVWSYSSFQKNYSSYHLYENILQELLARGHEVVLVQKDFGFGDALPKSLAASESINTIEIPFALHSQASLLTRYLEDIRYTLFAYNEVRKCGSFDASIVQSNNCAGFPVAALKRLGIPVLYNEQDIFPENAAAAGMINSKIITSLLGIPTKLAYKWADRIITISEDMVGTIENFGCDRDKIGVIHNWCRGDRDYLVQDEQNSFLLENNILSEQDGIFRVIYAGNIGRMQAVEVLVDAASILAEHNDICFYIVGGGANCEKVETIITGRRLKNVKLMKGVPEERAQDVYAAADLNVITLRENVIHTCLPSKTAACVFARRPFIATIPSKAFATKMLSAIDYMSAVEPGDPQALADEIVRIKEKYGCRYLAEKSIVGEALFSSENAKEYVREIETILGVDQGESKN